MKISCKKCKESIEVDPSLVGSMMNCPKCGDEFKVENPNLFPCFDCFQLISKHAKFCPHCGAVLEGRMDYAENCSLEETILSCHPNSKYTLILFILAIITLPIIVGIFILIYVIKSLLIRYTVTTRRVLVRTGLFKINQSEILINDMRAVTLKQSFLQRVFGVGDIAIGTAATEGVEITLRSIDNPQDVIDHINFLRND